jgi:3-keto-5-aminohexanoate cleavage enzyme
MADKIILTLAPVAGTGPGNNNPLEPAEIVETVVSCYEAGAALVHLHARDERGSLTTDLRVFEKTIRLIREKCNIIIEASTGGLSNLTAEERALPLKVPEVQLGSLNMGSVNFEDDAHRNPVPDIKLWLNRMKETRVGYCMEIFDPSNIALAKELITTGFIEPPLRFNFAFNYRWAMPYSLPLLEALKDLLPKPSLWGSVFCDSADFSLHLQAALHGARYIRVGFEDSMRFRGATAQSNVDLVQAFRTQLKTLGFELATAKEAREIMSIKS